MSRTDAASAATTLGFEPPPEIDVTTEWLDADELDLPDTNNTNETNEATEGIIAEQSRDIPTTMAQPSYWRLESMTFSDEPMDPAAVVAQQGLTEADWTSPGRSVLATPKTKPLMPWSRLWPHLKTALQSDRPTQEVDVEAYVRTFSRGEVSAEIPRLMRPAWPHRMSIWLDLSARLVPFWSDESDVATRLRKLCGKFTVRRRVLDPSVQARSIARRADLLHGIRPDELEVVLVLGDLGVYGTETDREVWQRTGRRLKARDVQLLALLPTSSGRISDLMTNVWNAQPWERGSRGVPFAASAACVERLLTMISPASHVEPGLLRDIRLLLPKDLADATTEAEVWNHVDVGAATVTGMMLEPRALTQRRNAFSKDAALDLYREKVSDTIRVWHEKLPVEVSHAEALTWHELVPAVKPPGDLQQARAFVTRLEGSLLASGGESGDAWALQRFGRALLTGMPEGIYTKLPSLQTLWVASFEGSAAPEGLDPTAIRAKLERPGQTQHYWVRQVGRCWVFGRNERGGEWPSYVDGPGSPIAWLVAARPWVTIVRGELVIHERLEGLSFSVEDDECIELRTDRCTVVVARWQREAWTAAAGRDRFGLWAAAKINGIMQRFRWIPPGRFLMGSHESEVGRLDLEGPQHWVRWTHGRWLADTPVTQALWEAVMGRNPCHFIGANRPAENVSWDDCQVFLAQLNERITNFDVRLPTEVEWEYACRAGVTTATWVGDLAEGEEVEAPMLDGIAWYRRNSRSGTHPVAQKAANPWGLYDMLGNVYEWCYQEYHTYAAGPQNDPDVAALADRRAHRVTHGTVATSVRTPVPSMRAHRVMRGGGWLSVARDVRAAYRGADSAGYRSEDLGFRLVRGPALLSSSSSSSEIASANLSEGSLTESVLFTVEEEAPVALRGAMLQSVLPSLISRKQAPVVFAQRERKK